MTPMTYTGNPRSRLETVLRAHAVSILALATALGVAYPSVHRVAAGTSQMTRGRAMRYAEALRELGADVGWVAII